MTAALDLYDTATDLYDANIPSAGFTIDTTDGPVDMVAVLGRLNGRKGLHLTRAELAVVNAVKNRYRELRPVPGRGADDRRQAYRALAHALIDAA